MKIAAHSAYDMFHGVGAWLLVWFFPASVWCGNLFLIWPFPGLCLLEPISRNISRIPLRLHCLCPEVQVPFSLQRLEFVPVKTNPGWQEYTTVDWKVVVPLILTNSPSVKGSGA